MKNITTTLLLSVSVVLCMVMAACQSQPDNKTYPVIATLDSPPPVDTAPQKVHTAINKCSMECFERIMYDEPNDISVWSLLRCGPDVSSDGYGIMIQNKERKTFFPDIHHGRSPLAVYHVIEDGISLTCGAIEGTAVLTERYYVFGFTNYSITNFIDSIDSQDYWKHRAECNIADLVYSIDPYEVQQALCKQLSYSINGNQITLYYKNNKLYTHTNNVKYEDNYDADSLIWIGEQMRYLISGSLPILLVTPGLKFPDSNVLTYDDMPTLAVELLTDNTPRFMIDKIKVLRGWNYEGCYLDEDNNKQNLRITFNRTSDHYDIQVGISHLTTLVEGVGEMHDDGMLFTATDTQDNPIEGLITLHNDTAKVCFTKSTWPSIHKGTSFRYTRQK